MQILIQSDSSFSSAERVPQQSHKTSIIVPPPPRADNPPPDHSRSFPTHRPVSTPTFPPLLSPPPNKTFIKSPNTGVVLRKHAQTGESVSDQTQAPIVTLADTSQLRVRVDVDEKDVSKIQVGQKVGGDGTVPNCVVNASMLCSENVLHCLPQNDERTGIG